MVEIGRLVIARSALNTLVELDWMHGLARHIHEDWGVIYCEDWQANDQALVEGLRLLSAYSDSSGEKYWIITEHDRSSTTILLPEDYKSGSSDRCYIVISVTLSVYCLLASFRPSSETFMHTY